MSNNLVLVFCLHNTIQAIGFEFRSSWCSSYNAFYV